MKVNYLCFDETSFIIAAKSYLKRERDILIEKIENRLVFFAFNEYSFYCWS